MRSTIFILFLFISLGAFSEEFTVFEKEGFYGIKDGAGQVTVPPVYEKLGWSTGEIDIFDGLIGYKKGTNWGLITVRNKALTEQKFYSLEPFEKGYIKGSIKGKFSNHLFYGLLDSKGKTVVSFNYFELTKLENFLLVSEFDGGKQSYGLVSLENEIAIPLQYKSIYHKNNFFVGTTFQHAVDVYHHQSLVQSSLDSIQFNDGIVGHRAGYAGYINSEGSITLDFNYKTVQFSASKVEGIKFPTWKVYLDQELQFEWQCDSIRKTTNEIWVAYLNGAQHILLPEAEDFDSKDFVIKKIENDFAIVQHSKSRKFSVISTTGKFLVTGYDSIAFSETHFLGLKNKRWDIINSSGTKLHRASFKLVLPGPRNFFIASKNQHWGIVDFSGEKYITFKYDSIIHTKHHYEVKYLNKWGALDFHGNWIVQPEFTDIQSFGRVIIGRKGHGYSVFQNNQFKFRTTYRPTSSLDENVVIQNDSNRLGLINPLGELLAEPNYKRIISKGDFIELRSDLFSKLIHKDGKAILDEDDEIEEVGEFSESHFAIKKNGRWGLVDHLGNLRISNRYDSIGVFKEGIAAIKIRDKWGFIDKEESLIIQPYYDKSSSFQDGLAIVESDNLAGIIDLKGEVIVALAFASVERLSTWNYLIKDQSERYGLVDHDGKFIIRPSYQYLEDTGQGIIVMHNNLWGYLDYDGHQVFKLTYSFIEVVENYLLLKI